MLTPELKQLLADLIFENKPTLMGKFSPGITNRMRSDGWDAVTQELVANGADPSLSTSYLRHTEWGNLQKSALEKYKKHLKSGAPGISVQTFHRSLILALDSFWCSWSDGASFLSMLNISLKFSNLTKTLVDLSPNFTTSEPYRFVHSLSESRF